MIADHDTIRRQLAAWLPCRHLGPENARSADMLDALLAENARLRAALDGEREAGRAEAEAEGRRICEEQCECAVIWRQRHARAPGGYVGPAHLDAEKEPVTSEDCDATDEQGHHGAEDVLYAGVDEDCDGEKEPTP